MPAAKQFTLKDVIDRLNSDRQKGFIDQLASALRKQDFKLVEVIDLTFHHDKQIAFRAAWLLDTMMLEKPTHYLADIPYFISRINKVTNQSCKRHYTRILLRLTDSNSPATIREVLNATMMDDVVEQLFDWVIDPKVKVAVKVFAADTLYNLSGRYHWINNELANQVEFMMRDGTAAIQSRGKKLLARLK